MGDSMAKVVVGGQMKEVGAKQKNTKRDVNNSDMLYQLNETHVGCTFNACETMSLSKKIFLKF